VVGFADRRRREDFRRYWKAAWNVPGPSGRSSLRTAPAARKSILVVWRDMNANRPATCTVTVIILCAGRNFLKAPQGHAHLARSGWCGVSATAPTRAGLRHRIWEKLAGGYLLGKLIFRLAARNHGISKGNEIYVPRRPDGARSGWRTGFCFGTLRGGGDRCFRTVLQPSSIAPQRFFPTEYRFSYATTLKHRFARGVAASLTPSANFYRRTKYLRRSDPDRDIRSRTKLSAPNTTLTSSATYHFPGYFQFEPVDERAEEAGELSDLPATILQ